jgi:hypothetical protein
MATATQETSTTGEKALSARVERAITVEMRSDFRRGTCFRDTQ